MNVELETRSVVYNMDCMEGMKQYPDKYFDLNTFKSQLTLF